MISTQRLIMILIVINVTIGTAMDIYRDPTQLSNEQVTAETLILANIHNESASEQGIWGAVKSLASSLAETTIGSSIVWGFKLIGVFIRGIDPLSVSPSQFTNQVEREIARWLIYFRATIMLIAVLETYLLIKNRKST